MPRKTSTSRPRVTRVQVSAERREQPDWDRYAWALLQYVKIVSGGKPGDGQPPRGAEP